MQKIIPQITPDLAVTVRLGEELDVKSLTSYLSDNLQGFGNIKEIRQFPGGFSNLTYLVVGENSEYILRKAPIGANIKGAHDMGREFAVLSKLKNSFDEVPKVALFCENINVIGSSFYLMEKINGIILRAKYAKIYDFEPSKWKCLSEILVDNLSKLHQIDINESGLVSLGKPEGYVERQVNGWIDRYAKSMTDSIIQMGKVGQWLTNNMPRGQKPTFIHNDFKYDNVVFNTELTDIKAILDWEMATVGDPLMDLGASLAYWCQIGEGEFLKSMNITSFLGNLTRSEVVERYTKNTGTDVSEILFYYVFGLYKNAVIVQQIYARWKAGFTKDPRFETLVFGVKELAEMAFEAINKNKI